MRARSSNRAATDAREGRYGNGEILKDQGAEPSQPTLLSWAVTTIRHDLQPAALTFGPPGTDRGRQSPIPRSARVL